MSGYISSQYDQARDYIKKQDEQIKIMREVLEFYADLDSWNHLTTESTKYYKIDLSDVGNGDFDNGNGTDDDNVGGKRAREALKKIEEMSNEL